MLLLLLLQQRDQKNRHHFTSVQLSGPVHEKIAIGVLQERLSAPGTEKLGQKEMRNLGKKKQDLALNEGSGGFVRKRKTVFSLRALKMAYSRSVYHSSNVAFGGAFEDRFERG